ncbi:MAG TPA: enoyl-CoA hydratase/isomerase family protein [Myxococcota bacterium]|nr:enoyl-CoA hydratase/isomerase family protein [Myxococcota bacterium]
MAELRSPLAFEAHSPLVGAPLLIVDLSGDAPLSEAESIAAMLSLLPCPTVGLVFVPPSPAGSRLASAFDLLVEHESDLAPVCTSAERCPLAAATLVQLLRHGRTLDLHECLVAESLAYSTLQAGPEFATWLAGRNGARPAVECSGPAVCARREGSCLRLTLDRPRKHNAFSLEMRDALAEGLALALFDDSIEELVLDANGPSFCSGGDLDEFGSLPDPATAHAVRSARSPARLLSLCSARARAEVHGACVGAGCELPAFCRHVRAREDVFFQLPEVGMGLVPGAGGTASLPLRIGRQRTAWLALSGSRIDAATALRWGLVDEIAR